MVIHQNRSPYPVVPEAERVDTRLADVLRDEDAPDKLLPRAHHRQRGEEPAVPELTLLDGFGAEVCCSRLVLLCKRPWLVGASRPRLCLIETLPSGDVSVVVLPKRLLCVRPIQAPLRRRERIVHEDPPPQLRLHPFHVPHPLCHLLRKAELRAAGRYAILWNIYCVCVAAHLTTHPPGWVAEGAPPAVSWVP